MRNENSILELIGRDSALFTSDIQQLKGTLDSLVMGGRFLVIGGFRFYRSGCYERSLQTKPVKTACRRY